MRMPQRLHDKVTEIINQSDLASDDVKDLIHDVALAIADHVEGERIDPSTLVPQESKQ